MGVADDNQLLISILYYFFCQVKACAKLWMQAENKENVVSHFILCFGTFYALLSNSPIRLTQSLVESDHG